MCVLPWLPDEAPWLVPMRTFAGSGLLGSVLVGLAIAVGFAGLGVAVVLALTSPRLVEAAGLRRVRRRFRRHVAPRRARPEQSQAAQPVPVVVPASAESLVPLVVPDQMTVTDLCQAWRSSYVALQRATSPQSRLRTVTMRALYLEELERRAGPLVRAWLESGARAASDPGRFLDPDRRSRRSYSFRRPWSSERC